MSESRLDLLKKMESNLLEELKKVRELMSPYEPQSDTEIEGKPKKISVKGEGIPRGKNTWEKYIQIVLKELGGKGKTQDVIQYALKANPKIKEGTMLNAIRAKISVLYREGTIGGKPGEYKKDGYEYFIKPQDIPNIFKSHAA